MHKVLPLNEVNSAKLLMHLLPVGNESRYADVSSQASFNYEEAVEHLKNLTLMRTVDGHPGILVRGKVTIAFL